MRKRRAALAAGAAALWASGALAAGGADVVDDAFVETPGVCHVESWLTPELSGGSVAHLGVGCTPREPHRLELDAAIERIAGAGTGDVTIQSGFKYTLLVRGTLVVGAEFLGGLDQHGRFGGATFFLPASITLDRYSTLNLDLGWQRTSAAAGDRDELFWGGQLSQAFAPHFTAIGEVFGDAVEGPGVQGGLRWSPGAERIDIDLRAARNPGHAGSSITLGLTWRS